MEEELIKLLNTYYHKRKAIENNFNITYNLSLSKRLVSLNKKYSKLIRNEVKKKPTIQKKKVIGGSHYDNQGDMGETN